MHKRQLISLALGVALCLSQGAVWAQPGRGNSQGCAPGDSNCGTSQGNGNRGNKDRFDNGHDNRRQDMGRNDMGRNDAQRGAGPNRSFYRGDRLPSNYRTPRYVVDDWRGHGLRMPPRGYHWVQTGGDYVLVAITTGIILELLLNH